MADAVVTKTEETFDTVRKVTFAITASSAGTATATTTYSYTGAVLGCAIVPGTSGDQPDDNFDIELTDGTYDLLAGQGANCDQTNSTYITGSACLPIAHDKISLSASGMGDQNKATVVVWIR